MTQSIDVLLNQNSHCPKNNLNISIPVTVRAAVSVPDLRYVHKGQTYTVAYAPAVTDLVFAQRFRSFLGHCGLRFRRLSIGSEYSEVTKKTHTHSFYCTQNTDSTVCTVCAVQYVCAVHIPLHDYLVRVLQRSANA